MTYTLPTPWWVQALGWGIACVNLAVVILVSVGHQVEVWLIINLLAVPLGVLAARSRMSLSIDSEHVSMRYWPFVHKKLLLGEVASCTYQELVRPHEVGGVGYRSGVGGPSTFMWRPGPAVLVVLDDGRSFRMVFDQADEACEMLHQRLAGRGRHF